MLVLDNLVDQIVCYKKYNFLFPKIGSYFPLNFYNLKRSTIWYELDAQKEILHLYTNSRVFQEKKTTTLETFH